VVDEHEVVDDRETQARNTRLHAFRDTHHHNNQVVEGKMRTDLLVCATRQVNRGLGVCDTTGKPCKRCSANQGCQYAGKNINGHW
jgi:hypothetical protein